MDQIVSATSHGKECMGDKAIRRHRKRKKLQALEVSASDTTSLDAKRRRDVAEPSSSSPLGANFRATAHNKNGRNRHVVDAGRRRRKTHFNSSLQTSGPSSSIFPPSSFIKGENAINGGNAFSGARAATSTYGSGLANQSTVTTSSSEQEGTSFHSFGQTSKVASETKDIVNLFSSMQGVGIGSIGDRRTGTQDHQEKSAKHILVNRSQQDGRKSRIRDQHQDGEVLSPFSDFFTNLRVNDAEVGRVSGSRMDASCGEGSGKTETTCALNSGCSSIEAGSLERARRATKFGCSIRQRDDSSELKPISCSLEVRSSFLDPDLCLSSCSDPIPSVLVTPYKLYQPREPSRMKGSVVPMSQRISATADEVLAAKSTLATEDYRGKNSDVTREASSSASEQNMESSSYAPTECKSSGGDSHPLVDSGQKPALKFVLSSGRMSKEEAKTLGVRPPTIDDDFDQYFAQLML